MKVNQASVDHASSSELAKARQAEALAHGSNRARETAPNGDPDRVEVSDLSERMLKTLSSDAPQRLQRLDRLAAAVRSGKYHVDARAVSRGVVEDALKAGT